MDPVPVTKAEPTPTAAPFAFDFMTGSQSAATPQQQQPVDLLGLGAPVAPVRATPAATANIFDLLSGPTPSQPVSQPAAPQ